jgi:hypothetical protein
MEGENRRRFGAGDRLEDACRVCKTVRGHTVIVADADGRILRVICDYCGSQHNYRGGGATAAPAASRGPTQVQARRSAPVPAVTERERRYPLMSITAQGGDATDLELLLRRIIREETGLTAVPMAERFRGGELILRPGRAELQEKSLPIETFFHKVVMLRNRLRVLEQQINAAEIDEDLKIKLQGYITGCYGTLTSFNILFAEDEDRFRGSSDKE